MRATKSVTYPLESYSVLLLAFNSLLLATSRAKGGRDPLRIRDLLLFIPAVHKISEYITQDRVTRPLRAPFVQFKSDGEHPKGKGLQKAFGELLTCAYCVGPWVTASLLLMSRVRKRETYFVAAFFTIVTFSDFLTAGYSALKKQA